MPQTDNSHLEIKIALRKSMLPEKSAVLDVFAGEGLLWKQIQKETILERYTAIEIKRGKNKLAINGDNRKILGNLNLKNYNVIDLDSYGIPFEQLLLVFQNKTLQDGTVIFITVIYDVRGTMNYGLTKYINATKEMIKKCKYLFVGKTRIAIKSMLYEFGIREWTF